MADEGPEAQELRTRVATLEEHVAHLEAAHQDMSEMIARQWTEIDKLIRTVKALHGRLEELELPPEARKPPHY